MMRFQEVQTRFVPESGTGQGNSQLWTDIGNPQFSDMDNEAAKSSGTYISQSLILTYLHC